MRTYGQFCPVAKASEILAERWTLLIVRELLLGSRRFNELEWGLPHIPRSLLTQRLRSLEDAGVLERKVDSGGKRREYHLTPAGLELFEIIKGIGDWGQKWVNHNIGPGDVDPKLLVWDMHRRLDLETIPDRRVLYNSTSTGLLKGASGCWWNAPTLRCVRPIQGLMSTYLFQPTPLHYTVFGWGTPRFMRQWTTGLSRSTGSQNWRGPFPNGSNSVSSLGSSRPVQPSLADPVFPQNPAARVLGSEAIGNVLNWL